jgi:hypothetical protein
MRFFARHIFVAAMVCLPLVACGGDNDAPIDKPLPPVVDPGEEPGEEPEPEEVTLRIVDADATAETKALLANLWRIGQEGKFMFGHHDDLWYGRTWEYTQGGSDTKAVCGEFPAVYSVDFAEMMDNRANLGSKSNQARLRTIREAYSRGEIITACIHINNPNGGDSWDNSADHSVWPDIITPGTDVHTRFIGWLDNLADMALELKADDGTLIPVLFRPFHEHTQTWSWWGNNTTETQFVELWRMTIRYLRDTRGVHNFLYAISPQMDSNYGAGTTARLLYRWPGDAWVDFLGMDCYHGLNFAALTENLKGLEELSLTKKKPCGVTETGQEGFSNSDYWTNGIVKPFEGRKVSMVVMWRNKYVGSADSSDRHFYSVWPGHPSEDDFRSMEALPQSIFGGDMTTRNVYSMPDNYTVTGH